MKRIIAFVIVLACVLSLCACMGSSADSKVDETIELKPLDASQSFMLNYNPDRAWRGEAYVNVGNSMDDGHTPQEDPTVNVRRFVEKYSAYSPQLCQVYFYLSAYKNKNEIDNYGMERMQQVFDCAKELGIKFNVRFAYQWGMSGRGEASDDVMLAHMKQLRPLLEKNIDVIHVVEAGFLGAWGEWHSYKDFHNETAILRGILEMVPEPLYVQVRNPSYKDLILDTEPEYARIGFHDDAFFGYRYCANADLNPGSDGWNQIVKEAPYVPVGGETFWGYESNEKVNGFEAIKQFSAFRQNSFSIFHMFIEDGVGKGYEIEKWTTLPITKDWLDSNGLLYSPNWFGEDGQKERTVFDYVSDYLGYRIEGQSAHVAGSIEAGGKVKAEFKLINYGFSAAFNMYSGFAILNKNGEVVADYPAGEPVTWNSRDPENYEDAAPIEYTISADLILPAQAGEYQLAFYLKNSAGTGARLNNDLTYNNGYSVFYTFTIEEGAK